MSSSQEVFALRKAGRFQEALAMGRQVYAGNPADPWNVKALAWALHSVIKQAANEEQKDALIREFLQLPVMDDDEFLKNARAGVQRIAAPYAAELQRAREVSRAGDWAGALNLLRNIAQANPGRDDVEVAIAWELCKAVQHGLHEERPDGPRLWRLVEEYGHLTHVPKPSDVHSRVLQWAGALARKGLAPKFCEFVKWWNPRQNLREEDFQGRQKDNGERYDSTVENSIVGVAKTIEDCANAEARQTAADFVEKYSGKYPDQEWFPYYRAVCMLATGRRDEAKALLMPIVRAKMTEFWAWQKLGMCFDQGGRERLQCLCRAATCPVQGEEYLLGVFMDLGSLLIESGHKGEGRFLLEKAGSIRTRKGWRTPPQLEVALEAIQDVPTVDADPFLKEMGKQAEEVLLSDLPWRNGILTRLNVDIPRDDGSTRTFHFVKVALDDAGKKTADCRISTKSPYRFLEQLPLGSPLHMRLDLSNDHPRVLTLKQRPEGHMWDVLPEAKGLVEGINFDKKLAAVMLENGKTGLVFFNSCPEAKTWNPGMCVACRWSEHQGKIRLMQARGIDQCPINPNWKEFSGEFRPRTNGSGGHVAGVFIHGRLSKGIEAGRVVAGLAVRKQGDDGRAWWEAVSIKGS